MMNLTCIHLEKRLVKRRALAPDMKKTVMSGILLHICHFPLASLSGIQCAVVKGGECPHSGPYGVN